MAVLWEFSAACVTVMLSIKKLIKKSELAIDLLADYFVRKSESIRECSHIPTRGIAASEKQ